MPERETKYEIIRILASIAITMNHIPCSENSIMVNWYIKRFFFLGGQFGVNLFVMIGAWFLCILPFKIERVVRIIFQIIFYSVVLDFFSVVLGTKLCLASFFSGFSYWFCFGYIVMLLIAPFLQKLSKMLKIAISIGGGWMCFICNNCRIY